MRGWVRERRRRRRAAQGVSAVAAAPAAAEVVPANSAHPAATGSLVAHVKDLSAGQISLMVGSSEFHVTDRALVAALAEAVESPPLLRFMLR